MDRHRNTNAARDEVRPRINTKNKENPATDTVYLIQNENEVLRMKNSELHLKIKQLKLQLEINSESIALRERQIEQVRNQIQRTSYKEDIEIENEKKLLLEKLALLKSNEDIILRKIREAREAAIFEEEKISNIQMDRKGIDVEILSLRAQNEGTKVVLRNLQEENQKLRKENQTLISKRQVYEPKEKSLSIEIQERIRLIKNQQQNLRNLKKYQTLKLMRTILGALHLKKMKENMMKIQRYSLFRKLAKKKVIQLSLFRKKYLLFIKNGILQKLRTSFSPLVQQQNAKLIISLTHNRRVKAVIWRKWRAAAKQAEFTTIRRFQFQNVLQKLTESFSKTNLCAAFNMIKYLRNNPVRESAAILIQNVFTNFMDRSKTNFLSCLRSAQRKYEFELQIDCSSKQQSEMLVLSLYFTSWCKYAKSRGIENINIKRRYFKELKKLLMLKNRRKLGDMLHEANKKISDLDMASKIFTQFKKQAVISRIDSLLQYKQNMSGKANAIESQLVEMRSDKVSLYREFSLLKVSAYLKKKMQKAFDIWRLRKQQSKVMFSIINLIEGKKSFDKNFAFSKILKKRFAMLKKSIRDKIQSCEFSYNYLLDENKHIKEILDKKQHELEKTKFTNIVKKIMKDQKEVKLKYFYQFLKNGYKYWKFRKTAERVDRLMDKKVKIVVMWLLKQNNQEFMEQHRIDSFVQERQAFIHKNIYKKVLKGFKFVIERNRRVRRVMAGIFSRNLELDSYLAFGKIRNVDHIQNRADIQSKIDQIKVQIMARNSVSMSESQKIQMLTNRLKDKEEIFEERKILGLFKFFVKNIYIKIGASFNKWRTRVIRENKVMQFAQILERKSRILMKNKFMLTINRKNEDYTINDLQQKLKRYQSEYNQVSGEQQKFLQQKESQSARMKEQNIVFKKEGQILERKTDYMVNIKIKAYEKQWGKKMVAFTFREWRKQKGIFCQAWTAIENTLNLRVLKETFEYIAKEMKEQNLKAKWRRKLSKIYSQTYRQNVGMAFKSWRLTNLQAKQNQWSEEQKQQMKRFVVLQDKKDKAIKKHNMQVDYRANDGKVRKIYNVWRQYAQKKINNNIKKGHLNTFIIRNYGSQFFRLLKHKVKGPIAFKETLNNFIQKWKIKRVRVFYTYTVQMKVNRHTVERLFVNKYCPFVINKVYQQFFSKIKNYNHNNIVNKKDHITRKIQTVIQTFEKKRKSILNCYLRRWRRNEYEMRIAKNLMRRLTKNAINWKVRDLFYSWKLETEAKNVKKMHEEQGEVKKRIIEINRLKVFLQDFKKQKGLLLQDDTGQLVVSPRFQQKKQQQIKKDNNSRYRFISRLILSMNGYAAPVKAWNNLKMYMSVRQKIRRIALLTKNCLRKPDLSHAFRVWHKAAQDFNSMFQTMQRKDLIRILNRQKDKMQMEYSKKVDLQQKIHEQMKAHKVFAYQEDRKQKLCAHIIVKNIRKVKTYALLAWKNRVDEMKDYEMDQLEDQGNSKINGLEQEVNELQTSENQLRQNNQKLQLAVKQALQIAEMVKRITEQRDILSNLITQKQMTCESLQEQNEKLNAKLYLAQKQAMNLLILSGERL